MKLLKYFLFVILLTSILGCADVFNVPSPANAEPSNKALVEKDQNKVEQESQLVDKEIIEENNSKEPEIPKTENIIKIYRKHFVPENLEVNLNEDVKWVSYDEEKFHKIACYEDGERISVSENLYMGDEFLYNFNKVGEYLCIDAIFGIRGYITVKNKGLGMITGDFLVNAKSSENPFIPIFLIFLFLTMFAYFVVHKPKKLK